MGQSFEQIADRIDTIGKNVATFYEPLVADMHQVRMQAREFEQLTLGLKSASDVSEEALGMQDAAVVLDAATCLRDAIGKALDTVSDTNLNNTFSNMQSHCDQLMRYSKELNSLSFLMLVTAASAASSGFSVEHLVGELREMATQLKSASSQIISTLGSVNEIRQKTDLVLFDTYQLIDASLVGLGSVAPSLPKVSSSAPSLTAGETPEQMAERLSGDLARLMPGLVACMQHPDAFAQRCDHVAQAARFLGEDLNSDTDTALRKLVIAQIGDICAELNRIQGDALCTLHNIADKGADTLQNLQTHLNNDTRLDEISANKDRVTETSEHLAQINNRSQAALSELSDCVKQFDGVESIFVQLNAMREGVRTSALNADLSERQSKINMPELRPVTKAVGDCATACGATIENLGKLYGNVDEAFEQIDESEICEAIAAVEHVLTASHTSLNMLSGQVEAIQRATVECSEVLTKLIDLGNSAHAKISSNVMAERQLRQIADDLGSAAGSTSFDPKKIDACVMSRVFGIYTIETEREVHRHVLPPAIVKEAALHDKEQHQEETDPLQEFLF